MTKIHVSATVNGDAVEFLTDPRESLLDCLRDHLGLTGSKEGCGTGDCGAVAAPGSEAGGAVEGEGGWRGFTAGIVA